MHPGIQTILQGLTYARFDNSDLEGAINSALKNISADLASVKFEFDERSNSFIDQIESIVTDIRLEARQSIRDADEAEDVQEDEDEIRGRTHDDED